MQKVAESCAPAMRRQELTGLCDELEMLLDQKVTGWLRTSVLDTISDQLGSTISGFGEALIALIGALENAISAHTRLVFRYRDT